MFDQVFWRAISGQINRWRKNVLHIDGTSLDKMEPHKIPFLYNFSPNVVPAPLDWPEWIRVTGMLDYFLLSGFDKLFFLQGIGSLMKPTWGAQSGRLQKTYQSSSTLLIHLAKRSFTSDSGVSSSLIPKQ